MAAAVVADKADKWKKEKEFGGAPGVAAIIFFSHILVFFLCSTIYGSDPALYVPTAKSLCFFIAYHVAVLVLAFVMPGVEVPGQNRIGYLCNAYSSFFALVFGAVALHTAGVFDLATLVNEYPSFLTTAVILGDLYSALIHFSYCTSAEALDVYDFFMGVKLHPRIGKVDLKMVAEIRTSWTLLFLVGIGAWIESARRLDTWANPGGYVVLAYGLYSHAAAKGEHFVPYTFDITSENFGWMLCWWNIAGVPLVYCYQALFVTQHAWSGLVLPVPAIVYYPVLSVLVVLAYCLWDEVNYQKCYFKAEQRGDVTIKRFVWPTFRHVKDPKMLKCEAGVLLVDGWHAKARKIHYTADAAMALLWGLSCGFSSFWPYFYFFFFSAMITHRTIRDEERCAKKYGVTWEKFVAMVPYRFIPGLF